MGACFYLVCPTDCIENPINQYFRDENYFYTSLGNSFNCDSKTLEYLKSMIINLKIKEICFVLSSDNEIILDALGNEKFRKVGELHNFYKEIRIQKERSKMCFQKENHQFSILSFYLNKKIKELEFQLAHLMKSPILITGKIYDKKEKLFTNIYTDLICLEKHHLN